MTKLIAILLITCATLHAQSVIVKATGAGSVHRSGTGAGSVGGVATEAAPATYTNYCDGRFTIFNTNQSVVLDNDDNGLIWTRDANIGGAMDWTNAGTYCSNLTYATHSDWRFPSPVEFTQCATEGHTNGFVDCYPSANDPALPLGHPFTNVQSDIYWNSYGFDDKGEYVNLENGFNEVELKTELNYVWPCRGP